MNSLLHANALILTVLLAALPQTVNVERNPDAKFDGYETFAWIEESSELLVDRDPRVRIETVRIAHREELGFAPHPAR